MIASETNGGKDWGAPERHLIMPYIGDTNCRWSSFVLESGCQVFGSEHLRIAFVTLFSRKIRFYDLNDPCV